jgi:RNA polymerase sigma-70 factor (ECF subfamily)
MESLLVPRRSVVPPLLAASPATTAGSTGRQHALGYDRGPRTKPLTEDRLRDADDQQARRRAEDAALLARIVDRDERAVEALYARYSGPLYSLAYQVTGADRFAQDVVQEVFVALWRDAGRFDPARGAVAPWLFSLARHKAIDLVRREANVRKRTADVDLELREADDDVDHETWLNYRRERVRAAIEELTPAQREALELAFFQGLTHVEVSDRLGIPLGTAKTRIRSALLRLRDILGDSVSELPAAPGLTSADA